MRRASLLILFLAWWFPARPADFQLTRQWQIRLGQTQPSLLYRSAVCPDGILYVADGQGRLAAVDAYGATLSDRRLPAFLGVRGMTCVSNRLYTAGTSGLRVFRRTPSGELLPLANAQAGTAIDQVAFAQPGLLFVHNLLPGRGHPLRAIAEDGRTLYSFGPPPAVAFSAPQQGSLIWDDARKQLLYLPSGRYEFHVYGEDGHFLGVVRPGPQSNFQLIAGGGRRPFLGDATGATRLADGNILVQVRNKGRWNGWPAVFLQLLDPDLKAMGGPIAPEAGILAGATASGALYFVETLGGSALTITHARLLEDPQGQRQLQRANRP